MRLALWTLVAAFLLFLFVDWGTSVSIPTKCKHRHEYSEPQQCTFLRSTVFEGSEPLVYRAVKWFDSETVTGIATVCLAIITAGLVSIAREQSKTTRAQLRAYVFFEQGHIKLVTAKGQQFIAAEMRFKNFGQTPAYKFKSWVGINLCESSATPFEGNPDGADRAIESVIGPGGAIDSNVSRPTPLLPSDVGDIKNGVKTIFIWGRLNYTDAFKEPQSYSFYNRNGDEVPGIGWSIRTSTKPHEAT